MYLFPPIRLPHSMTGIILAVFPSVCSGNVTYFSASYWQVVATTLDRDTAAYAYAGATGANDSFVHCMGITCSQIAVLNRKWQA